MSVSQYEFTAEQNTDLRRLADRMNVVGRLLILVAVLGAAESTILILDGSRNPAGLIISGLLLVLGIWNVRGATEFLGVTRTRGADLDHLMKALREVRRLFDLQFWSLLVVAALITIVVIAMVSGPGRIDGPYP